MMNSKVKTLSISGQFISGNDGLLELHHERRPLVPVGADLRGEIGPVQHGLNDPGNEGSAVEAALVLGHGDEGIDERILLYDVISSLVVIGVLQLLRLFSKQSLPQCGFHHLGGIEELQFPLGLPVSDKHQVQDPGAHLES